ncbi:MAG: PhnA domain-containing protein [Paracoccaceae bacterium]|nr:PhnA domain-containing protein [Paracoccaceae bacterium]
MALDDLMNREGGVCEFCGADDAVAASDVPPAGEVLLCARCREEVQSPADHWRCLEGAAWSVVPAVQLAVWRKLGQIDAPWAREAREGMDLLPEVAAWAEATAVAGVEHRDSNGAVLVQGDTVVLIKDLVVKGANFTAKRGTAVRGISLVADNAAQIEGRVEGQRIVILTEFVKKR